MKNEFLRIENITKTFGSFTALRDIDLTVYEGEFVCLLGPSGCGKTTLLRVIAGLEEATSGSVSLRGRDITAIHPSKRNFGIVFQSYALFPNMTIRQNVAFGLKSRKMPKDKIKTIVDESLELVHILNQADKYPSQLSGGQQQNIRMLTKLPRVDALWTEKYGKAPDEDDVRKLYERFEPALLGILENYADPIDGVIETVSRLREMGLKIGSTTGYTKSMMDIVIPAAAANGYSPDACFPPDGLPGGRPAPWMCYRNAEALGIYPMSSIIKVGDTIADIHEGVNAGCYSVGVVEGSSEMGLRKAEFDALPADEAAKKKSAVRESFFEAGAHFVIDTIREVPELVEFISKSVQNDRQ